MINPKILLIFSLVSKAIWTAPCCGGTATVPSLISGDDQSQLTTTLSAGSVIAEAPVGGGIKYRKENDHEEIQTLRIDAATLLSDRTQVGVTIPVVRRARSRGDSFANSSGLGDMALTLGYELLPEWSFNEWQPRGLVFVSTTVPTGGSLYDATKLYKVDSRGRGVWGVSSGVLLTKVLGNWDISFLLEAHHGFSREIKNDLGILRLNPGWGGSSLLALGLSPGGGNVRLGVSVAPSFEAPISTEGIISGRSEPTKLWTSALQVSYLLSHVTSMSLAYSDQTLIAASENSALNRSLGFLFQTRWDR